MTAPNPNLAIPVEFRDPPPPKLSGSSRWRAVADALRARPGEWAFIGRHNTAVSGNITKGRVKAMPEGDFEAVARDAKGSQADIYARFVGALQHERGDQ